MSCNEYIFNLNNKEVIRDFESAYKNIEIVYPEQFYLDSPKFRLIVDKIQNYINRSSVIDIGCGYGTLVSYLTDRKIDAIGIDISQAAITKGKQMYGDTLDIRVGDLIKGINTE